MRRLTACSWANTKEARDLYLSVFRNLRPGAATLYGANGPEPAGAVMAASLELDGQQFVALAGGPAFSISPGIPLSWVAKRGSGLTSTGSGLRRVAPPLFGCSPTALGTASRVMKATMQVRKNLVAKPERAVAVVRRKGRRTH